MEEENSTDEISSEDELDLLTAISHYEPMDCVTRLISPSTINMQGENGNTALHVAVEVYRWELVPVLLQGGADISIVNDRQETPLICAADKNAPVDIINQLVSPQNINIQDDDGDTVLHKVIDDKRWKRVPVLLQRGADISIANGLQETPLNCAVNRDAPVDIIAQLVSPQNINKQQDDGDTILHKVIEEKRWELVPVLLQGGADISICNDSQETPLNCAVNHDAPVDIITQLISPQNINIQDDDGDTVLHKVIEEKRWALVPVLLQRGADISIVNDRQETPLNCAANRDAPVDIITQLISPQNINMQDEGDCTALNVAVMNKRWDLVPVLLQHRADVNLCDDTKRTPLHWAADHDAPAHITSRLISPQNINMQDEGDCTVLHVAVEEKRWELVPVLLQRGADINMENDSQATPLHCATSQDAPADIIAQLISPFNINLASEDGVVLLDVVGGERWELVPVLLQHGADPFMWGILPEPPKPLSLQSLCIATIRSYMIIKSDEAFEGLGLPHLLPELKLKPLADEIIAANNFHIPSFP